MSTADDVLKAEFVASHELTEDLGSLLEFAQKLGDVCETQARIWFEDQQTFVRDLIDGERSAAEATAQHALRSAEHYLDGADAVADLWVSQGKRLSRVHELFWAPLSRSSKGAGSINQES